MPKTNLFHLPKAVLFDWDNTLVDTFPLIHASINHAFTTYGLPTWTMDEAKAKIQQSAREGLPALFADKWREAMECYQGYYREKHLKEIFPAEGAFSLLKALKKRNIPMAIVSNKTKDFLHKEIKHLSWEPFFSAIICSGDGAKDKPAPDLGQLALSKISVTPGPNVWFVGDAPVDWQCAEALGCVPIPIGNHHLEAKDYPHALKSCLELEKILTGLK